MYKKIIFRCDAGEISGLGTGHLQRSITLFKILKKKFSLKKKDILFIIKNFNKYKIAEKILQSNKINFYPIKNETKDYSNIEIKIINQFKSNLLIIDRLGDIKKNSIIELKKNHKKIFLIDDSSKHRGLVDLSINPLKIFIKKTKNSFIGHKFNILPSFNKKIKDFKKRNKNLIFISFGGFDKKNLTLKVLNHLVKRKLPIRLLIHEKYKYLKKISTNLIFYKSEEYYDNLSRSAIVISAGGMSMFDAIYFKKKTICIPQYKHQLMNINILNKEKAIYKLDINNLDKLSDLILNLINRKDTNSNIKKKQNNIINNNYMKKTLNLIYKLYVK